MAGFTNRGKKNVLDAVFKGVSLPTNFYLHLVSDTPNADTNTLGDLTEVPQSNGYTPTSLNKDATDFDTGATEDDSSDYAYIRIKDITWTASGGNVPASGTGALYCVLADDNATESSREIWAYWSLGSARTISDTQDLTLQDLELRLTES